MEKRAIEFYQSGDHKLWMRDGEGCAKQFLVGDMDTVGRMCELIERIYPEVYKALSDHYARYRGYEPNFKYRIAARFVRCNMGEDDEGRFDMDGERLNLEATRCPLKGSGDCPLENVVCNPKPSRLSKKETEVVRMYAHGSSIHDIAARLGKSFETVKHQLWMVKKRFNLSSTRDVVVLAYLLNLV